jgi:fatty acid desaturase
MHIARRVFRGAFWHMETLSMFRWTFNPRTRHPLSRLFAAVIGAGALLVLLVFGLFAAAALIVGGAVFLLIKSLRAPQGVPRTNAAAAPENVIEGEFTVTREADARHQAAR